MKKYFNLYFAYAVSFFSVFIYLSLFLLIFDISNNQFLKFQLEFMVKVSWLVCVGLSLIGLGWFFYQVSDEKKPVLVLHKQNSMN